MQDYPKVLVGCPTSFHKSYCLQEYLDGVKALTYPNYQLILVDNSPDSSYYDLLESKNVIVFKTPYAAETARERIVLSRNMLRHYFLENDYDYFLSLEQDVIPPPDVIERLLSHKKPVVSGVYYKEYIIKKGDTVTETIIMPLLFRKRTDDSFIQLLERDVAASTLLPVDIAGLGCILISKDVLEKLAFRYEPDQVVFDDFWFCQDLAKEHIPLYVDTSVKCKHLFKGMDWDSLQK